MARVLSPRAPRSVVVILGGGYGGISTALQLVNSQKTSRSAHEAGLQIIVMDERDGLFHTMGSPKALTTPTVAQSSWARYTAIAHKYQFEQLDWIQGRPVAIDSKKRLLYWKKPSIALSSLETSPDRSTCNVLEYDFLVTATGMRRKFPVVPKALSQELNFEDYASLRGHIDQAAHTIVVIGGGAVGVEMSGEIKHMFKDKDVVLIHSRPEILSNEPLPKEFKDKTLEILHATGVKTLLGQRVVETRPRHDAAGAKRLTTLRLDGGDSLTAGVVIDTTSKHFPNTDFLEREWLNEDGYIKVLPSLQFRHSFETSDRHFAVGDVAEWRCIKRVGVAIYMGQTVANNILLCVSALKQDGKLPSLEKLEHYPQMKPRMALSVGDEAVEYTEESGMVTFGQAVRQRFFGDDMGLADCWASLQLTGIETLPEAA